MDIRVKKRRFSAAERWAVYTVHGEKCYMCPRPLDLRSMQVDHIVPESLLSEPNNLKIVLEKLGLPSTFEVNNYGNWLPAHPDCNNLKRATPFEPSPLIQILLQKTAEKAEKVAELAQRTVSNQRIMIALHTIDQAMEDTCIDLKKIDYIINELIKYRNYRFRSATQKDIEYFEEQANKGILFFEPPLVFSHIEFEIAGEQILSKETTKYFGPRYYQLTPIYINKNTTINLTAVMIPASPNLDDKIYKGII